MAVCSYGFATGSSWKDMSGNAGRSLVFNSRFDCRDAFIQPGVSSKFVLSSMTVASRGLSRYNKASKCRSGLNSSFWCSKSCERFYIQDSPATLVPLTKSVVKARLFGPAIFEESKLCVLFLGVDKEKHPEQLPRTYTLTHSDITADLTLAVAREINKAQLKGWYNRLQRDEVLAEWKKVKGQMSLHVHCHISGGHWLLNLIARIRFYIFRKELPVVLEAFLYGDRALFEKHPDLAKAAVWVYFHSNMKEYNRLECWGPLSEATKSFSKSAKKAIHRAIDEIGQKLPYRVCLPPCNCCSRHGDLIPLPETFQMYDTCTP